MRYVDDFALFSDDKAQLWDWKQAILTRLAKLRLTVHEREAQVIQTKDGIPWLGFVVYPDHRRLKRRNVVNFTRKLEHNIDLYEAGDISFAELDASIQGWINHVRYADTWGLRQHIFDRHIIHLHPEPPPEPPPRHALSSPQKINSIRCAERGKAKRFRGRASPPRATEAFAALTPRDQIHQRSETHRGRHHQPQTES